MMNSKFYMLMDDEPEAFGGGLTGDDAPEDTSGNDPFPPEEPAPPAQPPSDVKIPENWKEALSEGLRKDPNLEKFKNFEDLANSYVHLQKHVGHDKVIIPGKNSDEKDWEAVYNKLGRPESHDKYEAEFKTSLKEDKEFSESLKKAAHEAGLNPNQFSKLAGFLDTHNETVTKQMQEEAQSYAKKGQEELKQEWGEKFDVNLKNAQKAFKAFADEKTFEYIKNSGLGNDPKLIKMFANISEKMKEDNSNFEGDNGLMTPNQIEGELQSIMGDMKHPYWNKDHPKHESAVKEVYNLNLKLNRN